MYQENDEERLGYFRKEVGHEYYLVHLFHPVEKVTEANAAGFAHNKPQLRFVTELFLDMSTSHCVRFDACIVPIYVVHNEHFENEAILFRLGMAGLYLFLENEWVLEWSLFIIHLKIFLCLLFPKPWTRVYLMLTSLLNPLRS